jgi:hypothetical protein
MKEALPEAISMKGRTDKYLEKVFENTRRENEQHQPIGNNGAYE